MRSMHYPCENCAMPVEQAKPWVRGAAVKRLCTDCRKIIATEADHHESLDIETLSPGWQVVRCVVCATDFEARRRDAKTCSPKCRVRLHRIRQDPDLF